MDRSVPELKDDVVFLRRWGDGDIEANVATCRDAEVVRWMPRIPDPYDESDAREFLDHAAKGWEAGTFFGFAIAEHEAGRLIGSIGVSVNGAIGEVGYFVFAGERRRGIGERALRLVGRWGLEELGLARFQLSVIMGNDASARLAEKAGFKREGVLRAWMDNRGGRTDVIMHSLLPSEIGRLSGDQ
ncbi:MAG: GNAT family protein [Gaiellaceae bacterium]